MFTGGNNDVFIVSVLRWNHLTLRISSDRVLLVFLLQYRSKVVTGVISAVSVFTFVVGICLIDRFRYLTEEQKQKRRERKEDRIRRMQQQKNGGVDNLAMEDGLASSVDSGIDAYSKVESNTHL